MLDRIALAALLLAAATFAHGQQPSANDGTSGFAVTPGTSFAASRPNRSKGTALPRTLAATVSTDIEDAIAIIRKQHVDGPKLNTAELSKASINAMLRSLDPHSSFYDKREFDELIGDQNSEYFGTGSTIVSFEKEGKLDTYVVATFAGSASERAGLRYGDRIVSVNGTPVSGVSSMVIRDMIRGPRGTSVKVTLERGGSEFNVELRRDRVAQPTVTNAFLLESGVGLIEMPEGFSFTSYTEFDAAFRQLRQAGMTSLVLDLRGNPGGVLEQSIKIAERFLPAGATIVSQRGRFPHDTRVWRSTNRSPERLPLVVLVDGDSASASEVIAGALQDNDRAVIAGEKTFGKGLVQSVLDLPGGAGLTLTTAKYFTPSGRSIQRDYIRSGAYDYYHHREETVGDQTSKVAAYTVTKRKVYGGDGITPDEFAPGEQVTDRRIALLDPLFYFSLELAASKVAASDISDETVAEFARFAAARWPVSGLSNDSAFIRQRLKYNLMLAARGQNAAREVTLKEDPQVAAAIRSLPRAAAFVRNRTGTTLSKK